MAMALTHLPSAAAAARWLGERVSGTLCSDSRQLRAGDAFIAWPGYAHDARRFVPAALAAGAGACLVEAERAAAFGFDDARIAAVPQLKRQCGIVASEFFGQPSRRMSMVASTGTNGKTSTTWWVAQALGSLSRRCAVVGTLGVGEPPRPGPAAAAQPSALADTGFTTPDAVMLQQALRGLVDQGFEACALEASSIGLHEQRLAGTHLDVALFTNLTQDHLDYHGSMAEYWQAKRALFAWPGLKAAVLNVDDAHGAALAEELSGTAVELWTCSVQGRARLSATAQGYIDGGLAFVLHEGDSALPVRSALIGDFNVGNLLLVTGALRALGVPLAAAAQALGSLSPVPGRMQRVAADLPGQPEVVVDYAHSPDALEKALLALQPFARQRGGQLWCVFGCGGNRDAGKRPMMGAIAAKLAGHVVLTSDNPRDEAPGFILAQILAGIAGHDEVDVIEDRREAIAMATSSARAADVILLAGKGHEPYQESGGMRRAFSDLSEARDALRRRAGVLAC
jgi:UDP-N-acetylmuramoyl-L-alanyl-D-glutamate--2,6-diaminopimelate ligase